MYIRKPFLLIVLLTPMLYVYSQEEGFIFRDAKFPENLQSQVITDVIRDSAGLLWMATSGGLCRYDGNETIFLNNKSKPAIPNSRIKTLFPDRQNNLWIGTENGLVRFDLRSWEMKFVKNPELDQYVHKPDIECIGQGRNGNIYAGSFDGRLYQVNGDSLKLLLDINRDYPNHFNKPSIVSISEPYAGELWVSTKAGKMIRLRIREGYLSPPTYFGLPELNNTEIEQVHFHPSGKCLLNIKDRGLYLFDTQNGTFDQIPALERNQVGKDGTVYMAPFNNDHILIFTNKASIGKEQLFTYNFPTNHVSKQEMTYPDNLKDDHIVWFKNLGNSLLMSLNNHVLELLPTNHRFHTLLSNGTSINSIRSIYKHSDGTLYVGSYKDRFIAINERTGEKETLGGQFVYRILPWSKDTLLLGTEGSGLLWFDRKKKRLSSIRLSLAAKSEKLPVEAMTTLTRVSHDSVWVGTYAGLYMVNPYSKTYRVVKHPKLARLKILHVTPVGKKLWIGTPEGLFIWDCQTNSLQTNALGNAVYCITPVDDTFWIGTHGEGVWILDGNGAVRQKITNEDGLADDIVYSILTKADHVAVATHNGLSMIDKQTKQIANYSRLDRLPANEFNQAAAFQQGNTFYLGTINGLLYFNAEAPRVPQVRRLTKTTPLNITSFTTERAGQGLERHYTFPYKQNKRLIIEAGTRYFTIGFGGVSELAKELQFFYRLDGHLDWLPLGRRQEITFVETPPGSYQLHLASRLPDGRWTNASLIVPLQVNPTFYQTIWFKCLLVLLFAIIIWAIFKYREYIQIKERRLRISIASDLHDEVGSSLTRIYYQADSLNSKINGWSEENKQLQQIADTSRQALSTMSDMVWSIDSRFDTLKDLVIRMKDYLYKLQEEVDFQYKFEIRGAYASNGLSQIIRQNLFLIFKEAVTNVIKYGDGSEAIIELIIDNTIHLSIKNTCSNPKELFVNHQGGRGLQNMKERAAKMNAQLSIVEENQYFQVHIILM
ncbi:MULTISPECIES: ligand-binding sensor domain-containing protein [Olivibacter]|uniref:Two-component regulator propeller domain-containing protein n=1 Tax=Olivibacter jilunii TaxID=985016 RepID=A0ABW6AZB2_9SPHI